MSDEHCPDYLVDSTFTKHDNGKPNISLVLAFIEELNWVHQCLEYGAAKYGEDNWKNADARDLERMFNAALRHLTAYRFSHYLDEESGLPHISHAITNLLFIQYLLNKRLYFTKKETVCKE